jgi:ribosomal protein S24E
MEFNITKELKNLSLNRNEYKIEVKAGKNPSKQDIIDFLKSDAELTVVKKIEGSFGKDVFIVDVVVYNAKIDKDKFEILSRKVKKKLAEEAKKAAEATKETQ